MSDLRFEAFAALYAITQLLWSVQWTIGHPILKAEFGDQAPLIWILPPLFSVLLHLLLSSLASSVDSVKYPLTAGVFVGANLCLLTFLLSEWLIGHSLGWARVCGISSFVLFSGCCNTAQALLRSLVVDALGSWSLSQVTRLIGLASALGFLAGFGLQSTVLDYEHRTRLNFFLPSLALVCVGLVAYVRQPRSNGPSETTSLKPPVETNLNSKLAILFVVQFCAFFGWNSLKMFLSEYFRNLPAFNQNPALGVDRASSSSAWRSVVFLAMGILDYYFIHKKVNNLVIWQLVLVLEVVGFIGFYWYPAAFNVFLGAPFYYFLTLPWDLLSQLTQHQASSRVFFLFNISQMLPQVMLGLLKAGFSWEYQQIIQIPSLVMGVIGVLVLVLGQRTLRTELD